MSKEFLFLVFGRKETVDFETDEMIVEPSRFSCNSFKSKPKFFWKCGAFCISNSTSYLDSVYFHFHKGVLNNGLQRVAHNTHTLKILYEPIGDGCLFIFRIPGKQSDTTDKLIVVPDRPVDAFTLLASFFTPNNI